MRNNEKYDVIVIGSGNGGLIASAFCAKNNLKTLLVEKHSIAGGFASSFVQGRFEFDISLHELCDLGSSFNPGSIYEMFKELGVNIEWIPVNEAYRLIFNKKNEKIDETLLLGEKNYLNTFAKINSKEKEKVQKLLNLGKLYLNAFSYISSTNGNPDKKILKSKYGDFLSSSSYTLDHLENKLKLAQKTKDIFNGYWCYLGVTPKKIDAIIYLLMTYIYVDKNAYIPKNRSQDISYAILQKFYDFNGEAKFNTEVKEILIKNNVAYGVKLFNNQIILADHIISNASKTLVYNYLIDPSNQVLKQNKIINSRNHGIQGINIYLGLNKSIQELNLKQYSYFICNAESYEEAYEKSKNIDDICFQATVCINVINPSASEQGTCMLSMTSFTTDTAWDKIEPRNYNDIKNKIAKNLINQFEQATNTKITQYIEEIEIATPVTFARYTNAFNGTIYGYDMTPWDSILMRLNNMFDEQGIENLRFCGGWSDRGHGFNSSYESGRLAYNLTMKDIHQNQRGKNEK